MQQQPDRERLGKTTPGSDQSLSDFQLDRRAFLYGRGHQLEPHGAATQFILWRHVPENAPEFADRIRASLKQLVDVKAIHVVLELVTVPGMEDRIHELMNSYVRGEISDTEAIEKFKGHGLDLFKALAKELKKLAAETKLPVSVDLIDKTSIGEANVHLFSTVLEAKKIGLLDHTPAAFFRLKDRNLNTFVDARVTQCRKMIDNITNLVGQHRNEAMFSQVISTRKELPEDTFLVAGIGAGHADVAYRFEVSQANTGVAYVSLPSAFLDMIPLEYRDDFPGGSILRLVLEHLADQQPVTRDDLLACIFADSIEETLKEIISDQELKLSELSFLSAKDTSVAGFLATKICDDLKEFRALYTEYLYDEFFFRAGTVESFRSVANRLIIKDLLPKYTSVELKPGNYERYVTSLIASAFPATE